MATSLIDLIENQFKELIKPFITFQKDQEGFKTMVCENLLAIHKKLEELIVLFSNFDATQQPKLGKVPVFKDGIQFYTDMLKLNIGKISEGLQAEI